MADVPVNNTTADTIVCYSPTMITTNGIWQGDNPLDYSLPLFILQLTLVVVTTRIMIFVLKPLRQPRVVSEILGGMILGPSVLGHSRAFNEAIFPLRSVMMLETMANIGLLYFLFLVGVEMDISVIKRTGRRKAMAIAVVGMILPFLFGVIFCMLLSLKRPSAKKVTPMLFLGVALSLTAFPVLARILAELKLVNTEIGRVAMSSALFNDICAWILLAFSIAMSEHGTSTLAVLWVILATAAFIVICIFVIRPCLAWIIRATPEGETISEFYICLILTGVMISGFITDAIGTHSVLGAFIFGLIIPNGPLAVTLIEKLEDFVSGLLLPLFFAISGLKTNIGAIKGVDTWVLLIVVTVLGMVGKVGGTLAVAIFYQMPLTEGVVLGLLMNTKGLVEMIVLNSGRDQKSIDVGAFSIMVIVSVLMTGTTVPLVLFMYKPSRRLLPYKRRTIQKSKPDAEFRIMVCVHTPRNVPTIISLLEASHPSKKSPICVYVVHLVELTGRASAMLIVHNTRKPGRQALNRTQAQSDHIIHAFQSFEQRAVCVTVQPLTAMSPYSTMHEDVCSLAEDKRVAFIIVPFHKQQTVDGGMEVANPAFRMMNQNVLANAPCSVGILVDRGLHGTVRSGTNQVSLHISVLFFGGPDCREALSYAWRMSDGPGVGLTVTRFLPREVVGRGGEEGGGNQMLSVETINDIETKMDEELIKEFRMATCSNECVAYSERIVENGEETVATIRSMENVHDLFIVGRGQGMTSPLTEGLTDWSECPELGAIGDLLASSDFAAMVSVLVVQQHEEAGSQGEVIATPEPVQSHDREYSSVHLFSSPRSQSVLNL